MSALSVVGLSRRMGITCVLLSSCSRLTYIWWLVEYAGAGTQAKVLLTEKLVWLKAEPHSTLDRLHHSLDSFLVFIYTGLNFSSSYFWGSTVGFTLRWQIKYYTHTYIYVHTVSSKEYAEKKVQNVELVGPAASTFDCINFRQIYLKTYMYISVYVYVCGSL